MEKELYYECCSEYISEIEEKIGIYDILDESKMTQQEIDDFYCYEDNKDELFLSLYDHEDRRKMIYEHMISFYNEKKSTYYVPREFCQLILIFLMKMSKSSTYREKKYPGQSVTILNHKCFIPKDFPQTILDIYEDEIKNPNHIEQYFDNYKQQRLLGIQKELFLITNQNTHVWI